MAPIPRAPGIIRGGRLADGFVVEASVVARLLGLRLLTLQAGVTVSPARSSSRSPRAGISLADARRALDDSASALAPPGERRPESRRIRTHGSVEDVPTRVGPDADSASRETRLNAAEGTRWS